MTYRRYDPKRLLLEWGMIVVFAGILGLVLLQPEWASLQRAETGTSVMAAAENDRVHRLLHANYRAALNVPAFFLEDSARGKDPFNEVKSYHYVDDTAARLTWAGEPGLMWSREVFSGLWVAARSGKELASGRMPDHPAVRTADLQVLKFDPSKLAPSRQDTVIRFREVWLELDSGVATADYARNIVFEGCRVFMKFSDKGYARKDSLWFIRSAVKATCSGAVLNCSMSFACCASVNLYFGNTSLNGSLLLQDNLFDRIMVRDSELGPVRIVGSEAWSSYFFDSEFDSGLTMELCPRPPVILNSKIKGDLQVHVEGDTTALPVSILQCDLDGRAFLSSNTNRSPGDSSAALSPVSLYGCEFSSGYEIYPMTNALAVSVVNELDPYTVSGIDIYPFRLVHGLWRDVLPSDSSLLGEEQTKDAWRDADRYFDRLQRTLQSVDQGSDVAKAKAYNRVEACRERMRLYHYRDKLVAGERSLITLFHYAKGLVLLGAVNFGHDGDLKFLRTCLWIVGVFMLLFWWNYTDALAAVCFDQDDVPAVSGRAPKWLISLYLSVWVFVALKPPPRLFTLSRWLLFLALMEWLLGIVMIILFLSYIAPNYPIFQKLFG